MYRKQKIQLVSLIFAPIAIAMPVLLNMFFAPILLHIIKFGIAILAIFSFVLFFSPIGRWRIGQTTKPPYTFVWWILIILLIQIGFFALFIAQNHFIMRLAAVTWTPQPMNAIWSWVACVALMVVAGFFAYISEKKELTAPFSTQFPHRWPTIFSSREIRRILDLYIQQAVRLFFIINIILLALIASGFFSGFKSLINPLNAFIATIALFVIYNSRSFKDILLNIENTQAPQGTQFIILWVLLVLILIMTHVFYEILLARFPTVSSAMQIPNFFILSHSKIYWVLYSWLWWIAAIPLLGSLLVFHSKGRTVRQLLLFGLLLPTDLLITGWFGNQSLIEKIVTGQPTFYITSVLALGFMLYLLRLKESTQMIWFGFIPTQTPAKPHRFLLTSLWVPAIAITGLILMMGFSPLSFILTIFVLPCLFIFYLLITLK